MTSHTHTHTRARARAHIHMCIYSLHVRVQKFELKVLGPELQGFETENRMGISCNLIR